MKSLQRPERPATAFACRAGRNERDVSDYRDAGPVKCNTWVAVASSSPFNALEDRLFRILYRGEDVLGNLFQKLCSPKGIASIVYYDSDMFKIERHICLI